MFHGGGGQSLQPGLPIGMTMLSNHMTVQSSMLLYFWSSSLLSCKIKRDKTVHPHKVNVQTPVKEFPSCTTKASFTPQQPLSRDLYDENYLRKLMIHFDSSMTFFAITLITWITPWLQCEVSFTECRSKEQKMDMTQPNTKAEWDSWI